MLNALSLIQATVEPGQHKVPDNLVRKIADSYIQGMLMIERVDSSDEGDEDTYSEKGYGIGDVTSVSKTRVLDGIRKWLNLPHIAEAIMKILDKPRRASYPDHKWDTTNIGHAIAFCGTGAMNDFAEHAEEETEDACELLGKEADILQWRRHGVNIPTNMELDDHNHVWLR